MNNLYLVRHGHTVWTGSGDIAGRTDVELSEQGVEAVKRLAASFSTDKAFTHWYCSPLKRTRTSSALLREHMPQQSMGLLPIETLDERIVELDFGDWEGMNWAQVHEEHGQILQAWGDDWINRSPPRGETFQQQVDRCSDWLKETLVQMEEVPESSAMVVSHGGSVRALLCLCLGWPLTEAMQVSIEPASLCWLSRRTLDDEWHVRMINSQYA